MKKVINFVQESIEELKKITWPSKENTIRLTGYVIGVSLGVGLFITAVDYLFTELLSYILQV